MRWVLLLLISVLPAFADGSADEGIPMRFQEGLLWVDVRVPTADKPLQFVVDTGAEISVVNADTARRLGLNPGLKVDVAGVHTEVTGRWLKQWHGELGGLRLPGRCLVLDLSCLAGACSNRIDGLLGADFFRHRIVRLDYEKQRLTVLDPQFQLPSPPGILLVTGSHGLTIKASVDASPAASVRLDTGCASAFEWVSKTPVANPISTRVAVGLSPISIPQSIARVTIGDRSLADIQIGIHAQPIFPGESGLLGNGSLSRFASITIDSVHHRLLLGAPRE